MSLSTKDVANGVAHALAVISDYGRFFPDLRYYFPVEGTRFKVESWEDNTFIMSFIEEEGSEPLRFKITVESMNLDEPS